MKDYLIRIKLFSCLFILFIGNKAFPSDYYWVGGAGNWSDFAHHWANSSGGSIFYAHLPYPTDNVFFDSNSFSTSGQVVTIDQTIVNCNDMEWQTTLYHSAIAGPAINTLKIYGSLILDQNMLFNFSGPVTFESSVSGNHIRCAGQSFNNIVSFNGIGGEWTLEDTFSSGENSVYLNNGTLNTNNNFLNIGAFYSQTNSTRGLNIGSSVVNLNGYGGSGRSWIISSSGMSFTSGQSTLNFNGILPSMLGGGFNYFDINFTDTTMNGVISDGGNAFNDVHFLGNGSGCYCGAGNISDNNIFHDVYFTGVGTWANAVINNNNVFHNVYFNSHSSIGDNNTFNACYMYYNGEITGSNTFDSLTFSPGFTYILSSSQTQTILEELNIGGNGSFPVRVESNLIGSPSGFYKTTGLVCVDFVILSDNLVNGGATFYAGANSSDLGGNSGWNFIACNSIGIKEEESHDHLFSISPNPASEYVLVKVNPESQICDLEILNAIGQRVYFVHGVKEEKIDCKQFKKGLYLIKLITENKSSTKKFIVH